MAQRERLGGLDALRGLAALAVMLHHYTLRFAQVTGTPFPLPLVFGDGQYGVELFFILSGFLILRTLERASGVWDFVVSRIARLYPAFVACLILTSAAVFISRTPGLAVINLSTLLANATMTPDLFHMPLIDGVYWTLLPEIMFYGLATVAFFAFGERWIEPLCGLWLAAALLLRQIGLSNVSWLLQTMLAIEYAPLFVIGTTLYRVRSRGSSITRIALMGASIALCAYGPHSSWRPISASAYMTMIAALAALVWLGAHDRAWPPIVSVASWIGGISYPLYLLHQDIGYVALYYLTEWGAAPVAAIFITIAGAFGLAAIVTKTIERPARRRILAWRRRASAWAMKAQMLSSQPRQ